jgi:multidrug resistance efflux pump
MDEELPSRRNALIALLVVVALVVAGFWISHVLREAGRTEDCLMRGGRNCAPLDPSLRR